MGVFSDNVVKYFESGLVCIPVGDRKAPFQDGWQLFCDQRPEPDLVEKWESQFNHADRFGLCLGQASGLVAFDFDYGFDEKRCKVDKVKFDKDLKIVESHILRALPQTPAIKVGKKGWTRIYKWSPELDSGSNISADRNGVRLFDFLSWHKQTILPPSIHSIGADGKPLIYRWIGPAVLECLDDIPPISLGIVQEMKLIFGESRSGVIDNSRHGRLFNWIMKISDVERDHNKLIELLIARDVALNGSDKKGLYLVDKNHFRGVTAADNAKAWLERVLRWKEAKRDLGNRERIVDSESWEYFFERSFPSLRKDILSKKVFFKLNDQSDWMDISAVDGTLRTKASELGLPRTHVKDQLERFILEKKNEQFLCDIPKWDGVDRISLFGKAISSSEFSADEITIILKHWGSGIFRRIHNSDAQNRCVILKGVQGLGKDSLVKAMLRDFDPYFENSNLSGPPKDIFEIISRVYVLHIEEFEQTQSLDVSFIKSIITQSSAFFRESFGKAPSRKNVALSIISTSNRDDILRDPTGNRRFIVIPVSDIAWTYPTRDSAQILAQFQAYFIQSKFEKLPDSIETKIKEILEAYTPPDTNETILDMYQSTFDELTIKSHSPFVGMHVLKSGQIQPALKEIARCNDISTRRVLSVLKTNGFSKHQKTGTYYYRRQKGWIDEK